MDIFGEPDVARCKISTGSMASRQASTDISSKYCKTAHTSRTAFHSYRWCGVTQLDKALAMSVSNQTILWSFVTPMSNCTALMEYI